ncbi:GntG family PLP-dependent aldolase [Paenibacillus sp. OSY-SE]|uniref:GntG family PLP-dependent aldolase n=1 Tax=Paenibacillus sp. OSY-SE TaxID=1196323 RepID=UPI0002EECE73|nr:GntG family PLP-dependent aldolase [Paenibacillus sp. OSY-SE]
MIELRSDTFTLPLPEMLETIQYAVLGDDGYSEDPTVKQLEELAASKLGKEAGVLLPSGVMANLASMMAHCPRGTKVLVSNESDIYIYEAGGASVCGGLIYEPITTSSDGCLAIDELRKAFPWDTQDPQYAHPALICLENPHNRMGGKVLPISYLQEVRQFADEKKVPIHMDGARIFNAAIALDIPVEQIAKFSDSVQFCLSKGLSAPLGSVVVGTHVFVEKVRWIRKMLGGSMRQAGVIAAPGIYALTNMIDRLEEDHQNARRFANGIAAIPGIEIDVSEVETNIVIFRVSERRVNWITFIEEARIRGLHLTEFGYGRIRAVTHSGINSEDIDRAIRIIRDILA